MQECEVRGIILLNGRNPSIKLMYWQYINFMDIITYCDIYAETNLAIKLVVAKEN